MGFVPKMVDPPKYPEKILLCGWRRDIDDMILVIMIKHAFWVNNWF